MLKHHQTISYRECLAGVALVFGTVMTAIPAIAQTHSIFIHEPLISQVNEPADEGVPVERYYDVEGTIKELNGDRVQLVLDNGHERTYRVPESVQRRYRMAPGSKIVLTVRDIDNDVVDVGLPGQPALDQ